MIRSMADEFTEALEDAEITDPARVRSCSVATGEAAFTFVSAMIRQLKKVCPGLDCTVYKIKNDFFGENITVAGLITGKDIYHQLRGKDLGKVLYLPSVMLRHEKDRFLDDTTPAWLENKLNTKIVFTDSDGYEFVQKILETP